MTDFSRDVDIGKPVTREDRIEILITNLITALESDSSDTRSVLDESLAELKRIRLTGELILGEEVEP